MPGGARQRDAFALATGLVVGLLLAGVVVPLTRDAVPGGTSLSAGGTVPAPPGAIGGVEAPADTAVSDGAPATPAAATSARPAGRAAAAGPGSSGAAAQVPGKLDTGLTTSRIKLGFLMLNVEVGEGLGASFPGLEVEQQQKNWQTFVDEINDGGGIAGRRIDAVFQTYNLLSQDDMRRSCLYLTEEAKVFAILETTGFAGPPVLCVTEEHGTPMITRGFNAGKNIYDRSRGLFFTEQMNGDRMMANFASELERLGELRGRTIGILATEAAAEGGDALDAALKSLGYKVAHRSNLSADQSIAASQIPVEVRQMALAGVDTVLNVSSALYTWQFTREADAQMFRPRYYASDWQSLNSDTANQATSDGYDGALGITAGRGGEWRKGLPEPAPDAGCRKRYEARTGETLDRNNDKYSVAVNSCTLVDLFATATRRAGIGLSRARFSAELQGLGELALATFGGGSFGPGKTDAADYQRTLKYAASCRCWTPIDDFRRSRY